MTVATRQSPPSPTPHRWKVEDYLRADEAGSFGSQRVELIEGEIIDMPGQMDPHAWAISRLTFALRDIFPDPYWIKIQATLRLNDYSAPEPDLAVLSGPPSPPASETPVPILIVEVSESSLHYDRVRKASLYAMNGIADYWVADVSAKQVEVFRDPVRDASQPYGWGYKQVTVFKLQDRISPLANPQASVEVLAFLA
jgi:Uma2 family endonuclease